MKTTKKGFTLIELIVVIAIIGVLAAILCPSMLGYVKKSKIQSANTTASSIYKAVNSAITEFDEEDQVTATGDLTVNTSAKTISATDPSGTASATDFYTSVEAYFGDIKKCNGAMVHVTTDGQCVAVSVKSGKYFGAYPSGVVTPKKWDKFTDAEKSVSGILTKAKTAAGVTE